MIKVNLIEKKKRRQEVFIAGVNIKEIRWVPLLIGVFLYSFDINKMALNAIFSERETNIRTELEKLQKDKADLIAQKNELKDLDDEIKKFEKVESKLQERLTAVKEVLAHRKNPQEIMLYMAKSIPSDVWVTSFSIVQNDLVIDGKASNYRSIGTFLESLRGSTFFNSDVQLASTSTEQEKETNRRNEVFKIQGKVARFE